MDSTEFAEALGYSDYVNKKQAEAANAPASGPTKKPPQTMG